MKKLFSILGRKLEQPAPEQVGDPAETGTFLTGNDSVDSRNLRTLLDSMGALISDQDPAQLRRKIVDQAVQAVGAERGILLLVKDGSLKIAVARDGRGEDIDEEYRYSTTVVKQVHESGQGLSLKIGDSGQGSDLSASVVDLKLRAVMCVRLTFQEKTLGVIYVDSRVTSREFSTKDLRFFEALAVTLSISLENARLVREALERQRLQQSLEIAQEVLKELLPENPSGLEGFDLAGRSIPAETAAGDYYDFVPGRDGTMGLVVGDVAGHGVGPAMVMSGARSALRILFEESLSESEILGRLNRRLEEDLADELFMSMLVCRLDPARRVLRYANAGQSAPLLLRADGALIKLKPPDPKPALGIQEDCEYVNETDVELHSGDVLVLFTDGILESFDEAGNMFGEEGIARVVRETRDQPAEAIVAALFDGVHAFVRGGVVDDDLTMVVLKSL